MIALRHLGKIFFLGILALTACRSTSKEKQDPFFSSEAYKKISDSIDRFPEDPELYVKRAQLLSSQQLQEAAGADLEKAWQLSKDPSIAVEWTSNLIHQQRYTEADSLLSQLERQYPQESLFVRQKALLLQKTNHALEALSLYTGLLKTIPYNASIWFEQGQLLLTIKDTAAAVASIKKAFEIEKDPYFGIALASLYQATHSTQTIAFCDGLQRAFPKQVIQDTRMLKGLYYADERQYALALQEFDQCIVQDYTFMDAHIEKGIVYFTMKQYDKALETFQRAEKVSSSHAEIAFWIGRCLEAKGETAEATLAYQRCKALDPGFKEAEERLKSLKK